MENEYYEETQTSWLEDFNTRTKSSLKNSKNEIHNKIMGYL